MKRVLICTVGGSPDPLIHAIEQQRPDFVYFLCSTGDTAAASDRTIERETTHVVKGECPECGVTFQRPVKQKPIARRAGLEVGRYHIETVAAPDNLTRVLEACERIHADIPARLGEAVTVIANYTGGTKTMSLGLALHAIRAGERWQLQVNALAGGDRRDLIKVTSGDMALPQDLSSVLAKDTLALAEDLAARHDYEGAGAAVELLLTRTPLGEQHRAQLGRRHRYFKVMAAWDRFDHDQALELARGEDELKDHSKTLRQLTHARDWFLGKKGAGRDTPLLVLVEDLLDNARRCAGRGRYDDAVGRLYRATELLAQIHLRHRYEIDTSDVDLRNEAIPALSRSTLEQHRNERTHKVHLGLFASYVLLCEMDDPVGRYFSERQDALKGFVEKRNRSLFAHGLQPVNREAWLEMGECWIEWIRGATRSASS